MRAIRTTCRITIAEIPQAVPYQSGAQPAIFCFWHGRMIMNAFLKPPGRPAYVLMSRHNDGALINATMRWFGIRSVRNSTRAGSTVAIRALLAITKEGGNIALTPDGPRGPAQKAANGAAFIAAKTGYPLLPVAFSATRYWRFKSWDRFLMPKPFSRIIYIIQPPQFVASDDDETVAIATKKLEVALNEATAEADRRCGVAA